MADEPVRVVTGTGRCLEVDTSSPLQILTGFYKGLTLTAWPKGDVTVEDREDRLGIKAYVAAKQEQLWTEMCGPKNKRKEPL